LRTELLAKADLRGANRRGECFEVECHPRSLSNGLQN
jgi:hypothetical protein